MAQLSFLKSRGMDLLCSKSSIVQSENTKTRFKEMAS